MWRPECRGRSRQQYSAEQKRLISHLLSRCFTQRKSRCLGTTTSIRNESSRASAFYSLHASFVGGRFSLPWHTRQVCSRFVFISRSSLTAYLEIRCDTSNS